jgi:hypothetical protein
MPVRRLPSKANLEHLRYQAKDLLRDHAARDAAAAQRLREFHPRFERAMDAEVFAAKLKLSDAQLAIAREAGFPSWARLKRHIEKPTLSDRLDLRHDQRIEDAAFRRAVELLDAGDAAVLRSYLKAHPKVAHQHVVFEGGNYFRNPTLLEFVAENPVRHGKMPANIVEVTQVILDAGVEPSALNETLMLVATGSVATACAVQLPMIDLLCDRGAEAQSAARAAALLGEHEAARALLGVGRESTCRSRQPSDGARTRGGCFRRLTAWTGILRYRWRPISGMRTSFNSCWKLVKIQTDTTQLAGIRTRRRFIRQRGPDMKKWCGCWWNAVRDWI